MAGRATHTLPGATWLRRAGRELYQVAWLTVNRFIEDRCAQAAGSLTYTTLLALVPLGTIAFTIFAAFPAFQQARAEVEALVFENLVPEVGIALRDYFNEFVQNAANLTAVGVLGLAVTSILLLATIETTFNTIWRVERERPIGLRILLYWATLTLGPILLGVIVNLSVSAFGVAREVVAQAGLDAEQVARGTGLLWLLAAALQAGGLALLFAVVPNRKVRWRDAAVGGIVGSLLFEVLKVGFAEFVVGGPNYRTIYGALAAVPIFLVWLYMCWSVVLIGAELTAALPERHSRLREARPHPSPRGRLLGALAVLAALERAHRDGLEIGEDRLDGAVPGDGMAAIEALLAARYAVRTEEGRIVLARDLRSTRLADLHRDLRLAIDSGAVEGQEPEIAAGPLGDVLVGLAAAERKALDLPIADAIARLEPRPVDLRAARDGPAASAV